MEYTETQFNLRYACRVLERHARLWRLADGLIRIVALVAGSAAFASLVAGHKWAVLGFGVCFALLQAIEFSLRPAEISAKSMMMRKQYAKLLAQSAKIDDGELDQAYQDLLAEDEIVVAQWLRHMAYNDVLVERGLDETHMYKLNCWQRAIHWL